jgi:cysteine synthase A
VDHVVRVEEPETLRVCHRLAHGGFLFGGSTGTVVSGAEKWLDRHGTEGMTAVAIDGSLVP